MKFMLGGGKIASLDVSPNKFLEQSPKSLKS